jgi:hypothetical protein
LMLAAHNVSFLACNKLQPECHASVADTQRLLVR